MKDYFSNLQQFSQVKVELWPQSVKDKIVKIHKPTLNKVRNLYGNPVVISDNSGYRSPEQEEKNNRSGTSQHCFFGDGAVDLWGYDITGLLELMKNQSTYTRICYYPNKGFIHCDFKETKNGERQFFMDYSDGNGWKYIRNL